MAEYSHERLTRFQAEFDKKWNAQLDRTLPEVRHVVVACARKAWARQLAELGVVAPPPANWGIEGSVPQVWAAAQSRGEIAQLASIGLREGRSYASTGRSDTAKRLFSEHYRNAIRRLEVVEPDQDFGPLRTFDNAVEAEEALKRLVKRLHSDEPRQVSGLPNGGDVVQLVTLSQAAVMVNRSKRTLADLKAEMPAPCVPGGKGAPAEWDWSALRPWLEARFGRPLPERFPRDRSIRL